MTPTEDGLYRIPGATGEFDLTTQNVTEVRYARRPYVITYYADGSEVASEQLRWGTKFRVGDIVDPARAGWRYVSSTGSTIDLSPDAARNVVTFVYAEGPSYSYVVRAVDAATGEDLAHWVYVRSGDVVVDGVAAALASAGAALAARGGRLPPPP